MNFVYLGVILCIGVTMLKNYINLSDHLYVPLVLVSVAFVLFGLWKERGKFQS